MAYYNNGALAVLLYYNNYLGGRKMKIFTDDHNNFHLEANYTSITRVTDPLARTHTHIIYDY